MKNSANVLADWADIIRKTFYDGGIEEIISTRRLVHIVKAYGIFNDKAKAIQVCVNRFDDETKQAFLELYDKVDADFVMPVPTRRLKNTLTHAPLNDIIMANSWSFLSDEINYD